MCIRDRFYTDLPANAIKEIASQLSVAINNFENDAIPYSLSLIHIFFLLIDINIQPFAQIRPFYLLELKGLFHLRYVEVLKLQVPKQQNSLEETQQWLTEGGVISAVKSFYFLEEHDALGGLERVGTMLDKARYSTSLSSKLTAHLQRINRTDLIPYIQYDTKHGKGGI